MGEAICSVDDHTIVSHEVQPYNRRSEIVHYDGMLIEGVISKVEFKCGCSYRFLWLAIFYWKLKNESVVNFE